MRAGSGATAVQVVRKRHGKLEIIEHIGSGHSPVEGAVLVQRARTVLEGAQESLELDLEPPADSPTATATS